MENRLVWGRWLLPVQVALVLLLLAAGFLSGMALGGWQESLKLRSSLESIPDINICYPDSDKLAK